MRTDGRWTDNEELPLSGIDAFRSNDFEMQLVVLRGLQKFEETVRLEHTDFEELSANEGADFLLDIQKRFGT